MDWAGSTETGRAGIGERPAAAGESPSAAVDAAAVDAGTVEDGARPEGHAGADTGESVVPQLPEPARQRLVGWVAALLDQVDPVELPGPVRPVARFAPRKRARAGGPTLLAMLAADDGFRQHAADLFREHSAEVALAIDQLASDERVHRGGEAATTAALEWLTDGRAGADGTTAHAWPADGFARRDSADLAAGAYLLRPPGWQTLVRVATEAIDARAARAAEAGAAGEADRLRAELATAQRRSADAASVAREQVEALRSELAALRRHARELGRRVADAEAKASAATQRAETESERADTAVATATDEVRRLQGVVRSLSGDLDDARKAAKGSREVANMRVRLLIDTLAGVAIGLRRELALPATDVLPADVVVDALAAGSEPWGAGRPSVVEDPAVLDELLALPRAHLVVDGYNVTKSGFGDLTLEAQRYRLTSGLAGIAARTQSEVTVVFDGVDRAMPLAVPSPRGVRVVFSRTGETADSVIVRIVQAEPPGRVLVVVSSDQEVVADVRRAGAWSVPSATLLRRIG